MFSNDRNELRKFFFNAWQKHLSQEFLDPLEMQIVNIILLHPEYQQIFANPDNQDKDFFENNPFLHISLHLAIHEQIATNRPPGIQDIYKNLCEKFSKHDVEHRMMECLQEILGEAKTMPDERVYLQRLRLL